MLFSAQSKEQVLTAAEVYGLDLKANLAVLSSCETGFGKLEKGEGIMSMSRAFTYAGVGSTLMTLWKIPDIESSIITTNFYESLDNGFSKNIALQQAKKAYLKQQSDPALKEPYFWAGFVLTGDISPIITKSNPSRSIWIVIVVIILVMFTFLILQKRKRLR
jgi:CHAT domain-containing protein